MRWGHMMGIKLISKLFLSLYGEQNLHSQHDPEDYQKSENQKKLEEIFEKAFEEARKDRN